ncbi:HAD family hydrolase [Lachnospiraceae bacterium 62-35]
MYRCCIFDLDGTLLNTIHALTFTTNRVMERFGLPLVTEEQMKHFVGDGYKKQVERALLSAGDKGMEHYEEALLVYMKEFEKYCLYQVEPYDGIQELLDFLKKQGIKIAVFSNKPHLRAVENIEGTFGKGFFDLVAGEKPGIKKKPDPAGVFLIMEKLQVRPEECLYFGDTNTDMKTGKAAGLDTVGVLWGFRGREELEKFHPKYLISHPLQIIEILSGDKG